MNIQGIGSFYTGYQSMQMRQTGISGNFHPPDIDASKIMEKKDANQDGVITIDETKASSEMFSKADADGNGELTTQELEEMLANGPPLMGMKGMGGMPGMSGMGDIDVETILDHRDKDGDGAISRDESVLPESLFSKVDQDKDGLLSAEEIEQSLEKRQQMMEQISEARAQLPLNRQTAMDAYKIALESFTTGYAESQEVSSWDNFLGKIA